MLDSKTLVKQLKYQGKQYGSIVRGGNNSPHVLTQAAERIESLEKGLYNLLNDVINFSDGNHTETILKEASALLQK